MIHKSELAVCLAVAALFAGPAVSELPAAIYTVEVTGRTFIPADLTIDVGDTVHWVWGVGIHNVESGVGGTHDGNFRSGDPVGGITYDLVFDQDFLDARPMSGNVYPYYCAVHVALGMVGSITVQAASACATCGGDLSGDLTVNAVDIQAFLSCYLTGDPAAADCVCADMDADGIFDETDLLLFVEKLLNPSPGCP